jgi:hypothetical protein
MLTLLRTFDAPNGWAGSGFLSSAHWLIWWIGIGPVAAREHVRVARALGELKLVDAAFAAGKLTFSKVRAITRVVTPAIEQEFIDIAVHATASQIERIAAAFRRVRAARGSSRAGRTRICGDSSAAMIRRAGWSGSSCNCRLSRRMWYGGR